MSSRSNLDILKQIFNAYFDPVQDTYALQKRVLNEGFWIETIQFDSFTDFFTRNKLESVYLSIDIGSYRENNRHSIRTNNLDFLIFEDDAFEVQVYNKKGEPKGKPFILSGKNVCRESFNDAATSDFFPYFNKTKDRLVFMKMLPQKNTSLRQKTEDKELIWNTEQYVSQINEPANIFRIILQSLELNKQPESFNAIKDKLIERSFLWNLDLNFIKDASSFREINFSQVRDLFSRLPGTDFSLRNVLYIEKYTDNLEINASNSEFLQRCIMDGVFVNNKLNRFQEDMREFIYKNKEIASKFKKS